MSLDYAPDPYDLVEHQVICMREGCEKTVIIKLEPGMRVPRGLRKWCKDCTSSLLTSNAGVMSNAGVRDGNRKA